ncbi:UPF0480 protein like protein [Myotis brandtii]|uniref:Endoplasmic reticulum membrane protein complex subunit 7 n=1 Tax=Myotis brandtii TaxID=109478 RepID=S7NQD2_MYOBR|nr:UPF0480 protein like protein [Myotis brandtii]
MPGPLRRILRYSRVVPNLGGCHSNIHCTTVPEPAVLSLDKFLSPPANHERGRCLERETANPKEISGKGSVYLCTKKRIVENGFEGTDGSFVVHDIPSGSYVVEVISPAYRFDPIRVDITSKGKMRARYVNYIKTSEVVRLPYPLQMKSSGPPSYFIKRESWGWTDFLMNPMVMMMVLPLLIFVLLPKVVNTSDPDMRREMEQSMNMLNSNHELPDVSEFMTRLFSSKSSGKSSSSSSKTGKSGAGKRR